MATQPLVAASCPTCGAEVKPVPAHVGRLRHWRCAECHDFYCEMYGELVICETPELHVAFYEDYRTGIRG